MIDQISKIYSLLDRSTRRGLIWMFVLMFVAAILEMAGLSLFIPLLHILINPGEMTDLPVLGDYVSGLAGADSNSFVLAFCLSLFGFFVFKNLILGLIIFAQQRFVQHRRAIFAKKFLHQYLCRPYVFHLQRNTSELVHNSINQSMRLFVKGLAPLLQLTMDTIISVGIIAVLLLANPQAALIMGGVMGLSSFIFYRAIGGRVRAWGEKIVRLDGETMLWANQALGSIKETKLLGAETFFAEAFGRPSLASARILSKVMTLSHVPRLFLEVIAMGGMLLLVATLVVVNQQDIKSVLPALGLFGVAAMRLLPAFSKIVTNLNTLRENSAAVNIIHRDYHDSQSGRSGEADAVETPAPDIPFTNDLRLHDVSFHYPEMQAAALSGVNITIIKGQSVAFVGRSGAGKTSLVDIILGLLSPSAGRLLVDGRDILSNLPGWQRRIGYIPQEIYLTDDTLRRNIALGLSDEDIDDGKIKEALQLAQLSELVRDLPGGLDTVVGERGARLSGGQRQRIGIARALYSDPEILVMDEATSALDGETEKQISTAINGLAGQKTIIIIAHRLSTVRHCDTIVLLDKGRIVEAGTFADLAAHNVDFSRMVEMSEISTEPV